MVEDQGGKKQTAVKKYQSTRFKLFFLDLAVTLLYLSIFQFSGFSRAAASFIHRVSGNEAVVVAGYLAVFGFFYYVVDLPLKFYAGFVLEHKFLLSNQTLHGWIKDEIKSLAVYSLVSLAFVEVLYFLLRSSRDYWWLWIGFIWFMFSVFFARIFPVLILPLFYKYRPVDNLILKRALLEMAMESGVKILDVFQIDFSSKTRKANAALIGMGKSKRIILADNLLAKYTDAEIKAVLAHELGHYKYRHIWKLLLFGAVSTLVSFYLLFILTNWIVMILDISSIANIEAFPFLMLIMAMFSFMTLPIQNGYSRRLEREADAFALQNTQDADSFISCMERLARQNLSDAFPNRFIEIMFYSHPPISKRIKYARENFKS